MYFISIWVAWGLFLKGLAHLVLHKWIQFNWERAGLCVILALVAGLATSKAAQLSRTEMETRTEHAEYSNLDSLSCGVQHVWSVKLDVWVIRKLFWIAKSYIKTYCLLLNNECHKYEEFYWVLEQLSMIESKCFLASCLQRGGSSFMFSVSERFPSLFFQKISWCACFILLKAEPKISFVKKKILFVFKSGPLV